jgi:hypothetical protein
MKYRVPKALVEYLCTQKEPESENPTHDEIATRRWILKRDSESLTQNKEKIHSPCDEKQKNCRKETWRTKQKSSRSVQQLYMRHLFKYLDQEVGKAKVRGNDTQLLLRVNVKTPEGETKQLLALVDTGAQVNLYRTGLFDECQTKPAKKPLSLVTVDGTRLSGGQREIWLQVEFFATSEKQKMGWQEDACFLEGDIQVDLILGYPWLRTVQLGILPHKDALFFDGEPKWLLRSVRQFPEEIDTTPQRRAKRSKKHVRQFRTVEPDFEVEDLETLDRLMSELVQVQKMQYKIPGDTQQGDCELRKIDKEEIAMRLRQVEGQTIGRVITSDSEPTEWGENQALVDELRAKLHADYDGVVLCDEALPDPPVRGPHCEARIYLKPGAEPKKQKPILLQGERREAIIDIAKKWLKGRRTESCEGPWSSPAFPVRKKPKNGEAWLI